MVSNHIDHQIHASVMQSVGESLEVGLRSVVGVEGVSGAGEFPSSSENEEDLHVLLPVTMVGLSVWSVLLKLSSHRCYPDRRESHPLDIVQLFS
jgi:hypothetical protein